MTSDATTTGPVPARIADVSGARLRAMVSAPLGAQGYELVACQWVPRQKTLQLSIDHTLAHAQSRGLDPQRSGISLDDCEVASRAISAVLDDTPPFDGDEEWTLEVSSPGVERPLASAQDFARFVGVPVRVKLKKDAEATELPAAAKRQWLDATLTAANDQDVHLDWQQQSLRISLEDIERAHVRMAF